MRILRNIFVPSICACLMMSCVTTNTNRFGNVADNKRTMMEYLKISVDQMDKISPNDKNCMVFLQARSSVENVEMRAMSLLTIAEWIEKSGDKDGADDVRLIATLGLALSKLHSQYWNDLMTQCYGKDMKLKDF